MRRVPGPDLQVNDARSTRPPWPAAASRRPRRLTASIASPELTSGGTFPLIDAAGVQVVPADRHRPVHLPQPHQRAERDHLAETCSAPEQVDVRELVAVPALGLERYLPVPAEGVEAVDVHRAQVDLHRLVDVVEVHPQGLDLGPVHVQVELRVSGPELGEDPDGGRRPSAACATRASVWLCNSRSPRPPRSSTMSLNPPATLEPGDRGRAEHLHVGVLDLGELAAEPGDDGVGAQARVLRGRRTASRMTNIAAEVGAVGPQARSDMPDADVVWATPGSGGRSRPPGPSTAWVRLSEAESGSWMLTMSRPMSCSRDEPERGPLEHPVRQPRQPAVDGQHQQAHPQQPADRPGVGRGAQLEAAVEQPARNLSGQNATPAARPSEPLAGRRRAWLWSRMAARAGLRVSELIAENTVEAVMVTANWR